MLALQRSWRWRTERGRLFVHPWDGQVIHDPMQFVNVTSLPANLLTESTIELVDSACPRSPVRKFAEAGGGLHHVCYEVDDLQIQIQHSQAAGATLVRAPLPAKAFGGRKISWVVTSEKLLVEYLERSELALRKDL
jgi:methylmalonyl-CoA/ethylmalonyl-CoA epimerase